MLRFCNGGVDGVDGVVCTLIFFPTQLHCLGCVVLCCCWSFDNSVFGRICQQYHEVGINLGQQVLRHFVSNSYCYVF